jgi:hypothetical protein
VTAGFDPGCATIAIGRVAVGIRASDRNFLAMLEERYAGFIDRSAAQHYAFDVLLTPLDDHGADAELRVVRDGHRWQLERGDFRADWDPLLRRGRIRQSRNPYAIDAVLRIVHTLVLAGEGGFLVHAASAIRNGRASVFAGASGAGKTTIARFASADARLSQRRDLFYVRSDDRGFHAYGTPPSPASSRGAARTFTLRSRRSVSSRKGRENRVDDVSPRRRGTRASREHPVVRRGSRARACGVSVSARLRRPRAGPPPHVRSRCVGVGADPVSGERFVARSTGAREARDRNAPPARRARS